jgi:hypothetical protein
MSGARAPRRRHAILRYPVLETPGCADREAAMDDVVAVEVMADAMQRGKEIAYCGAPWSHRSG